MRCILIDSSLPISPDMRSALLRMASQCQERSIEFVDHSNLRTHLKKIAEEHSQAGVVYFRCLADHPESEPIELPADLGHAIDNLQVVDCYVASQDNPPGQVSSPYPLLILDATNLSTAALSRGLSLCPELALMLEADPWSSLYRWISNCRTFTLGYAEWFSEGHQIAAESAKRIWQEFESHQKSGQCSADMLRRHEFNEREKLQPFRAEWDPPALEELRGLVLREFTPESTAQAWAEDMISNLLAKTDHPDLARHVTELNREFLKIEQGLDGRTTEPLWKQLANSTLTLWPLKDSCRNTCSTVEEELSNEIAMIEPLDANLLQDIKTTLLAGEGLNYLRQIGDQFRAMLAMRLRRILTAMATGSIIGLVAAAIIRFGVNPMIIGVVAGAGAGYAVARFLEMRMKKSLLAVAKHIEDGIRRKWNTAYTEKLDTILHRANTVVERQVKNRLRTASLYTLESLYRRCVSIASQIERMSNLDPTSDAILKDRIRQRLRTGRTNSAIAGQAYSLVEKHSEEMLEKIRENCFALSGEFDSPTADHVPAAFDDAVGELRAGLQIPLQWDDNDIRATLDRGALCRSAMFDMKLGALNVDGKYFLILPRGGTRNNQVEDRFNHVCHHCYSDTLLALAVLSLGETKE